MCLEKWDKLSNHVTKLKNPIRSRCSKCVFGTTSHWPAQEVFRSEDTQGVGFFSFESGKVLHYISFYIWNRQFIIGHLCPRRFSIGWNLAEVSNSKPPLYDWSHENVELFNWLDASSSLARERHPGVRVAQGVSASGACRLFFLCGGETLGSAGSVCNDLPRNHWMNFARDMQQ